MKFIFSVRLFQILFSELIKMSSEDKKKQTYFDKTWLDLGVCSWGQEWAYKVWM